MSQEQRNLEFRQLADVFIDVANKQGETVDNSRVGSAMLFASARFASFVVASHSRNLEQFESEVDNALEFFSNEFKRMLGENLEEYKSVFKAQQQATEQPESKLSYEHLMKKDDSDKS